MDILHTSPNSKENMQRVRTMENKIIALLRKEEVFWLQRSRVSWMVEGDRNIGVFHRVASGRKRRNHIFSIRDDDGIMWKEEEDIERVRQTLYC